MKFVFLAFALAVAASAGCAPVKPFQREYLSAADAPDGGVVGRSLPRHWQSSREGSEGGFGAAGGGCGCN